MSTSHIVECTACGRQCHRHETDAGHCPDCGGECWDLADIYGPDGEPLDDSAPPAALPIPDCRT